MDKIVFDILAHFSLYIVITVFILWLAEIIHIEIKSDDEE